MGCLVKKKLDPTFRTLKAWQKELDKYSAVLEKMNARLQDKETSLNAWELRLIASSQEETQEELPPQPYTSDEFEDDEVPDMECGCAMCNPHLPSIYKDMATKVAHTTAESRDIALLEALYKLPDRRRKKK